MLDELSKALPEMLWLTQLKQDGGELTIEGRCTTLTALSDFVANLEHSGYFRKPVEILDSQVDNSPTPGPRADQVRAEGHVRDSGTCAPGAQGGTVTPMAFELGLNKLPWKAQVGVFLVVAVAALGGFYWYYVQDVQASLADRAGAPRRDEGRHQQGARRPRGSCRNSSRQVGELQARLELLRAVLPEEKDVSDLLRRMQTLATQSNLQIKGFKPAADRHEADARRVADHSRARWHVSQPRRCSSIASASSRESSTSAA